MKINKKGQLGFTNVLFGLLILFIAIVLIVAIFNTPDSGNFGTALAGAMESVSDGFMAFLGPFFNILFNFKDVADANTKFLMVLTFILISIIITGTLDSINIFGEDKKAGLINLAIGIIVSIIGVRFMPQDLWGSLTAPSSAFVATILVGVPFVALGFVTMKIKFSLARRLLWLFYLVFMSYLIFTGTGLKVVYVIFLVLAVIIMIFDSTVRHYFNLEHEKLKLGKSLDEVKLTERIKIRQEIKELMRLKKEALPGSEEVTNLNKQIDARRKLLSEFSSE